MEGDAVGRHPVVVSLDHGIRRRHDHSELDPAERTTYPAPGLAGGRAGGRGGVRLNGKRIDNRRQDLLEPGDEIVLRTPGGYGPARARDKTLAKRDRALGYGLRKKHNG